MAKKHYNVSYQYSESVFCSNIAHAESIEAVEEYYSGYSWCNISECDEWELEAALRRGTPIVEVEAVLPEEAEPETADANQSAEYNYCEAAAHIGAAATGQKRPWPTTGACWKKP